MKKLESNRSGQIVKQLNGYDAFIPEKLYPTGPTIETDMECVRLLSESERALGELKGITELLPDPDLFVAFYVQKEALLSSQIEGTQCSLDEVIQIDENTRTAKPVDEVVNYIKAMNDGLELLKNLPMSLRLIHQIHAKLLEQVRGSDKTPGEYKRSQNWIGPSGCTLQDAAYVPPPPEMMLELMGDFEKFYYSQDTLPILIKTAVLHYQFETIHPYLDGNGRLGRLLITFGLCEQKVLQRPLLYLSLFFKEHRTEYYQLLMDVRFRGAWEEWIKFFLRGIRSTSEEASRTAREILAIQQKDSEAVKQRLGRHKIALATYDYICHRPIVTIPQIKKVLKSNYPTVKKVIDGLCGLGILSPYGSNERNKQFQYHNYLNILRRGT
jgi:Fic family protein